MSPESSVDPDRTPAAWLWLIAGLVAAVAMAGVLFVTVRQVLQDSAYGQPRAERAAQRKLPYSHDLIWAVLSRTGVRVDRGKGAFTAVYPKPVLALAGRTVAVTGYMLPLETGSATHHFLLSKYTPVCAFCPPGEPNEVIEVRSASAVVPGTAPVTVSGRLGLQRAEGDAFFHLEQADVED